MNFCLYIIQEVTVGFGGWVQMIREMNMEVGEDSEHVLEE